MARQGGQADRVERGSRQAAQPGRESRGNSLAGQSGIARCSTGPQSSDLRDADADVRTEHMIDEPHAREPAGLIRVSQP